MGSAGRGSDGNSGSKKGEGGVWSQLRSFGAAVLEGFVGIPNPSVSRRDPVAERERPAATRQIHRSMKAWRDREAEDGEEATGKETEPEAPDQETHRDETEDAAPVAKTSVSAKLKVLSRAVAQPAASITAQPKQIARMASGGPSTAGLTGSHDSLRTLIASIKKQWGKTKVQEKLRKNPAEKAALEKRKDSIETEFQKNEANYGTQKGPTGTRETIDALATVYNNLKRDATALDTELGDYTKSVEQVAAESATFKSQIVGSLARAEQVVPDVNGIPVLNLPSFAEKKGELTALFTRVREGKAKIDDETQPLGLADLRKLDTDADKLRVEAEAAQKLTDINQAIEPFVKAIDEIIKNTTKAGRPDAEAGDGSSEAAAIVEAKTGKPTKGCWHGPKCRTEGTGIANAITPLREIVGTTTDAAMIRLIEDAIRRGEERRTGLKRGEDAWYSSPHKDKAK